MRLIYSSAYGKLRVASEVDLFRYAVECMEDCARASENPSLAMSGGGTPKKFFSWLAKYPETFQLSMDASYWFTSDERFVALEHPESNFGNLERFLLDGLDVAQSRRCPWPTSEGPQHASKEMNETWVNQFGDQQCFDLCFLGMGDDGHTASIFPGSPLIDLQTSTFFESVQVPGKGWRLSITPYGLKHCKKIIVMVTGANKAQRMQSVIEGNFDPQQQPIQLLKESKNNVEWLLDEAAASVLKP